MKPLRVTPIPVPPHSEIPPPPASVVEAAMDFDDELEREWILTRASSAPPSGPRLQDD